MMKMIFVAFGLGLLLSIPAYSAGRSWNAYRRIKAGLSHSKFSPLWYFAQIGIFLVPAYFVADYLIANGEAIITICVSVAAICSGFYLGTQDP